MPQITGAQAKLQEKITAAKKTETELQEVRSAQPSKIKTAQMPDDKRYNKLKHESKFFMNIIKMICYRAETSVANLIAEMLSNRDNHQEKRMIVKKKLSPLLQILSLMKKIIP